MKYFFPLHLNGGNRGCEAIAKGTAILLNEPKKNLIGLTTNPKLKIKKVINIFCLLFLGEKIRCEKSNFETEIKN
jgi:colanic acid/amylovoran biosynthesis protein